MSSPRISCPMPFRFRSDIVRMDSAVEKAYTEAMEMGWDAINQLRRRGVSDEFAAYLLPNAVSIQIGNRAHGQRRGESVHRSDGDGLGRNQPTASPRRER